MDAAKDIQKTRYQSMCCTKWWILRWNNFLFLTRYPYNAQFIEKYPRLDFSSFFRNEVLGDGEHGTPLITFRLYFTHPPPGPSPVRSNIALTILCDKFLWDISPLLILPRKRGSCPGQSALYLCLWNTLITFTMVTHTLNKHNINS